MDNSWIGRVKESRERNCRKSFLAALLILPLLVAAEPSASSDLPSAKPEEVGLSSERLQRIGGAMQRNIDEGQVVGAVALVARKGRVAYFEARGMVDVEAKKPMHKDAIFRMASSTKPVTGVAIMMLMEEGKLRLTDPVSRFIPEFKDLKVAVTKAGQSEPELVPAKRAITIQDLLTHTSGLGSGGAGSKDFGKLMREKKPTDTLADFVPRLATLSLDFQPGTQWRYSGLAGMDTLGRIVEIASGLTYDEFLRQRLFEPLGIKDTFFVLPDDRESRRAPVYRKTAKGMEKANMPREWFGKAYFSGAGGLVSTAEDYFRFGQMLLNGGELNGKRLLSPRTVKLLSSNHVGDLFANQLGRGQGLGFGFCVEVVRDANKAGWRRSNGSYGWDGAFGTTFVVDPKEHMVLVLMMQTHSRTLHRDFENAVMQAIIE
jgi:CubicO group peptidase (beta-lactamase class C family)